MRYIAKPTRNGNWKVVSYVPGDKAVPRRIVATFENSAITLGVLTARYYARKFAKAMNKSAIEAEARQKAYELETV